jgi:peroxiredoxin
MFNYKRLYCLSLLLSIWNISVYAVNIGYPAPDFTLVDTSQEPINLTDFWGKYVVLEWFNPHCRAVQQHREIVRKLAHHYQWRGIIWLGINSTHYMTQEDNLMWQETSRLNYRILADFTGETARRYQVKMTPQIYIVNPMGIVVYSGAIDDNVRGDKSQPFNYVAAALEEILTDNPITYPQTDPYGCLVQYQY